MNNETMDINNIMDEQNKVSDLKLPSEEEMARMDKIYSDDVKNTLAELRKTKFTGTSEEENSSEENEATCTVQMTSQYQAEEVSISPSALLKIFNEAQIKDVGIEQLALICVEVAEATRRAFNNAREKTHKGSEAVFNHLMEKMQKLFKDSGTNN